MNSRVSLQPPYSYSKKQFTSILSVAPLGKDKLTRGEYYLIKNMLEDPTTLEGILTFKPDISEYTTFGKMYLDT